MSKVVSPIVLKSYVRPGANGFILIELIGEDGRLLASEGIKRNTILAEGAYIKLEIPFETNAAAEMGRLQISTKDKFGRVKDVKSVHILLLSTGANDINRGDSYPRAIFFYPKAEQEIFGDTLPISGEYHSYNKQAVILELLDEEGKTLGLRTLSVEAGSRERFETTIAYKVEEPVEARLLIRQADENFEGRIYLHSRIVILNPYRPISPTSPP